MELKEQSQPCAVLHQLQYFLAYSWRDQAVLDICIIIPPVTEVMKLQSSVRKRVGSWGPRARASLSRAREGTFPNKSYLVDCRGKLRVRHFKVSSERPHLNSAEALSEDRLTRPALKIDTVWAATTPSQRWLMIQRIDIRRL